VYKNIESATLSPNGNLMALLRLDPTSRVGSVWLSSPPGSEPRPYSEAPFIQRHFDTGVLRFSPQGDRVVAWIWSEGEPTEFWVLPLPRGKPFQVLRTSTADCLFPARFSVLPDGRHIVLEMQPRPDSRHHLFVADFERDEVQPLTQTTLSELQPAISPDGERIAFTVNHGNSDMVLVPLDGSPMETLLATAAHEAFPSWSRRNGEIAYACNRRGTSEIWMYDPRSGWNRPVVRREDFGDADTLLLLQPAFSADGQRVAYSRYFRKGRPIGIWISPVAGGKPVALTPGTQERTQWSPTWSPDGKWIAYSASGGGRSVLRKAEVGSRSQPVALYEGQLGTITWSPRGDWIACETQNGLTLVKADGGGNRVLATEVPLVFGWSHDGMLIYGLRPETKRLALVSIDVETGREKRMADVGPAPPRPAPHYFPWLLSGFSLSPDGKSFVTSINRSGSDIWILENFQMPAKSLWKSP
jgi:Tol biopolymer transport system component